jgi:transposase
VLKLDSERKDWRKDTVILLDNAPYHSCSTTMDFFEGMDIPILFTGPHSYDAAPCELLFAQFKAKDINPNRLPTGKT